MLNSNQSSISKLLNNIAQTANWPSQFKVEYVTPIGKIPLPQSEDDLRPISLTAFFSKLMEQYVVNWLLEFIGSKMDFRQYGGTKGNSICHYLIEFITFILNYQEMESTAIVASILITKLSKRGVPG